MRKFLFLIPLLILGYTPIYSAVSNTGGDPVCNQGFVDQIFMDSWGYEITFASSGEYLFGCDQLTGPEFPEGFANFYWSIDEYCNIFVTGELDSEDEVFFVLLYDGYMMNDQCLTETQSRGDLYNYNGSERGGIEECWFAVPYDGCEDPCSDEDCPLEFSDALLSYEVQCAEDLPTSCEDYLSDNMIADLTASNSCTGDEYDVFCTILSANSEAEGESATQMECEGVTAKYNTSSADGVFGPTDAALRLYGLSSVHGITASDYFLEDPLHPLDFLHTPQSGTARLTGTVYCRDNVDQILHIDATFDTEQNASDWLALDPMNLLLVAGSPECAHDPAAVSVFNLADGSYLQGDGDLSGILQLSHAPTSYNRLFQLGDGVNNHNCNYGLGGWFSWNGLLNGEAVSGVSGDIILDLEACVIDQLECEEYSEFVYTALDLDCGRVLSTTVRVDRNDTEGPMISSGPLSVTVQCDDIPEVADNAEVIATDNCTGLITIVYMGETPPMYTGDPTCPSNYTFDRRWSATDACGNPSIHTQTITVVDTTAPDLDSAAADATAECDGAGNSAELTAWLDSNGGVSATDNCGDVTWT